MSVFKKLIYKDKSGKETTLKVGADAEDIDTSFTQASARENIKSGDKLSTILSKLAKWFADLKAVAFSNNYNDLDNKPTSLKNPSSLTIKQNGDSGMSYDGSSAATVNITPSGIGAAAASHNHTKADITDFPSSMPASDVPSWAKQSTKPSYTKSEVGLGNVPNVATNDQTPTFTAATSRTNIASGEKLSTIFGKIAKWFTDLKTVAWTGNYSDLSGTPTTMKNPSSLTIKQNGDSGTSYDGSSAATVNITPSGIGAAPTAHSHTKSQISDFPTSMTPTSHASTGTTYGKGDGSYYGHLRLSSSTSSSYSTGDGYAATPSAVKSAYDLANRALTAAGEAQAYTEDMLKKLLGVTTLPDKTLANNTPEVIQKVAQAGLGAAFWSVGDKIGINLNGTVGALTFSNETYYAYILGFNHNPSIEGAHSIHFQFGKTSSNTDIAFVDGGYKSSYSSNTSARFVMNSEKTSANGWSGSYMRQTICPAFFNALPAEWRSIIAPCTKYSDNNGSYNNASINVTATQDNIWLLAEYEVHGTRSSANSAEQNYQQQYAYYKNGNNKVKYQHSSTGSACVWWLRSAAMAGFGNIFCLVGDTGGTSHLTPESSRGFAPGFMVA